MVDPQKPEATSIKGEIDRFVWLPLPKLFCYISPCDGSVYKGLQQKPIIIIIIIIISINILLLLSFSFSFCDEIQEQDNSLYLYGIF